MPLLRHYDYNINIIFININAAIDIRLRHAIIDLFIIDIITLRFQIIFSLIY